MKIMKNPGIFIIVFLLSMPLYGQNIRIGLFVDPQMTWMFPDAQGVEREGAAMGVSGGLILNSYFADNYAFSTGISIGTQGGSVLYDEEIVLDVYDEEKTLPAGTTVDYKLRYLTIPVGLKLKTNEIGYFTYFAHAGLTGQIRLKAKADANALDIENDNITESIKLFNMGYHFGGGLEYGIGQHTSLMLGLIYTNGFLDVTTDSNQITSGVLALRAGVMF